MTGKISLVLAMLLVVSASASADQVYRWKDKSGKWHFSSVPPDGVAAEPVKFSNMSVVAMPRPAPRASEAEPGLAPECLPGYSGDAECAEGARRGGSTATSGDDTPAGAPVEQRRTDEVRKDSLETGSEQIKGYSKSERVDEINRRNERAKNYERGKPPTLNEKLRAKNAKPTPLN